MGFTYYGSLVIQASKCGSSSVSNFPLLVSVSDPTLKSTANGGAITNADGYDIIFTSDQAGTSPLNWEVESWSASAGTLLAWVQVPTLPASSGGNLTIYVQYGNSAITTQQNTPSTTWSSDYKGVYHLGNGSTISTADSTSNGHSLTLTGSPTAATGIINGGASFNGTSQFAQSSPGVKTGAITISGWFYETAEASSIYTGILDISSSEGQTDSGFGVQTYGSVYGDQTLLANLAYDTSTTATTPPQIGAWTYITAVYDGSTGISLYANGSLGGTATGGTISGSGSGLLSIAGLFGNAAWNGIADEVRLYAGVMPASQILAEYNNQSDPATFISATMGQSSSTTETQTITGISRIQVVSTSSQSGISRIQASFAETLSGLSRIEKTFQETQSGQGRIQANFVPVQTGLSRIQVLTDRSLSGISRITNSTLATLSGISRIQASFVPEQTGQSRIQVSLASTISGIASIISHGTVLQTITGVACIYVPTPEDRTIVIPFEDRTIVIPFEDRTININ